MDSSGKVTAMASGIDLNKVGRNKLKQAVTGEEVELRSLWKDQACVLLFLRRMGCLLCRWIAKENSKLKGTLEKNKVRLIGIVPEREGLEEFLKGDYFAGELFVDEDKNCYNELGFKRYHIGNIIPAILEKPFTEAVHKAYLEGIHGNLCGDVWQSGGTLLVGKGGELILYFIQESPGDYLPLDTITKALGISANVVEAAKPESRECKVKKEQGRTPSICCLRRQLHLASCVGRS
ncbi:prostamide/prostaglandin F synthase [Tiliqua scincoides]|uniref:prostamide/prostaglandin F synthase n=1 Tax=Tiliqua scincoides TaxID=71010 RepID=UPI003462ACFA